MEDSKSYLCRDIRGNVHIVQQKDLIQRTAVYAIIQSEQGVLLTSDRSSKEKWDLPGGGVEMGEDLMSALHREVLEESGLKITSQPEKVCQFTEYFYDIDSNTGWESNRIFYKVSGVEGDVVLHGNGDDIVKAKYSQNPLEDESISPVSREVLTIGG